MRLFRTCLFGALLALAALTAGLSVPARAELEVDLELVLSVDASGSVDAEEYALQIGGIAAAFRDRAVIEAIAGGYHRRIAVAMVVWADAHRAKDATDWWIIASPGDARAFAAHIEQRPRRVESGATGIASGIATAIAMVVSNDIAGLRRVVDVSGDGVENATERRVGDFVVKALPIREIMEMRALARAQGITVNGLAILNDMPDLAEWYETYVRFGEGSFVMSVDGYADFAAAMRIKLLREIGNGPAVTDRRGSPGRGNVDVPQPQRIGDHADG